jgi:hypothetical protein
MTAIILAWFLKRHKIFCQATFGRAALKPGAATTVAEIQPRVLPHLAFATAFTAFTSVNKNSLGHNFVI